MPDASDTSYSLRDLERLTATPARTIRFYIQKGLVDRPLGETRAARYTGTHLGQVLEIRKWQNAGLSLERIGELLTGAANDAEAPPLPPVPAAGTVAVWSRVQLAPGLELHIEPGAAGLSPEAVRAFAAAATRLLERTQRKDST